MKLQYKIGDITKADEDIIAHGCNCQGKMGSGVALAIRNAFPEAYQKYMETFTLEGLHLGDVVYAHTERKIIANCMTQYYYGRDGKRYVSYDAVNDCMYKLNETARIKGLNVALPLIGAGLGGGRKSIIINIIEENFTDVKPVIYVLNQSEILC